MCSTPPTHNCVHQQVNNNNVCSIDPIKFYFQFVYFCDYNGPISGTVPSGRRQPYALNEIFRGGANSLFCELSLYRLAPGI